MSDPHASALPSSPPPVPLFKDFFKNASTEPLRSTAQTSSDCLEDLVVDLPFRSATRHSTTSNTPTIAFSKEEIDKISAPFRLCLVFKFYKNHPPLQDIKQALKNIWKMTASCSALHVDRRHVLIRFTAYDDYIRAWTREAWSLLGQSIKIFRWTPWFKPGLESPLVPLWFSLPHLPACLFSPGSLASIASGFGRLLRIGPATHKLGRIEAARICVEVDVSNTIPEQIWIAMGDDGFMQNIIPDFVPLFCLSCRIHGHISSNCMVDKNLPSTANVVDAPGEGKPQPKPAGGAPEPTFQLARRRRSRWTPVKDTNKETIPPTTEINLPQDGPSKLNDHRIDDTSTQISEEKSPCILSQKHDQQKDDILITVDDSTTSPPHISINLLKKLPALPMQLGPMEPAATFDPSTPSLNAHKSSATNAEEASFLANGPSAIPADPINALIPADPGEGSLAPPCATKAAALINALSGGPRPAPLEIASVAINSAGPFSGHGAHAKPNGNFAEDVVQSNKNLLHLVKNMQTQLMDHTLLQAASNEHQLHSDNEAAPSFKKSEAMINIDNIIQRVEEAELAINGLPTQKEDPARRKNPSRTCSKSGRFGSSN